MSLKRAAVLLFCINSVLIAPALSKPNSQNYHHSYETDFSSSKTFTSGLGDTGVAASINQPVIQTQATYKGCSSASGCGGVTLENGKVVHKYGNPAALGLSDLPDNIDPTELHKKFALQASDVNSAFAGKLPSDGPFWWATNDSPFKNAHDTYMKWLNDGLSGVAFPSACAACPAANTITGTNKKVVSEGSISNKIDISHNPFLNGQISGGFTSSGSSQFSKDTTGFGSSGSSTIDISKNPFLNGNINSYPGQSQSSSFESSYHATSSSGGSKPFVNTGCAGGAGCGTTSNSAHQSGTYTVQQQQVSKPFGGSSINAIQTTGSGCNGAAGSCGFQGQSQITTGFEQQSGCTGAFCNQGQPKKPIPNFPPKYPSSSLPHPPGATAGGFKQEFGTATGELTLSCSGQGYVCVQKSWCQNGLVVDNYAKQAAALIGNTQCKTSNEVCCKLKAQVATGSFSGSFQSTGAGKLDSSSQQSSVSTTITGPGLIHVPGTASGSGQFTSSSQTTGFGQTGVSQFGQSGFGQTSFGQSTNSKPSEDFIPPFTSQQQTNVYQDSFSSQSIDQGYVRPGSSVLKPGIPYLPPEQPRPTTTTTTPRPYRPPVTVPPYKPPTTRPTPYVPPTTRPTPYVPPVTRPPVTRPPYQPIITTTPGKPYLPPKEDEAPQPSSGSQQIIPRPYEGHGVGSLILDINRQPPPKPINPPSIIPNACAAALKCTKIEFCAADGTISNTSVVLTREQAEFRVPLTDCKDTETGLVGKCCRDLTYTDPWPTNQLGQWVPGAFGDTGAYRGETYRNGQNNKQTIPNGPRGPSGPRGPNGPRPESSLINQIYTANPNQNNIPVAKPPSNPTFTQTNPNPPTFTQTNPNPPTFTQTNPKPPTFTRPSVNTGVQVNVNDNFSTGQLHLPVFNTASAGTCGIRRQGKPSGNRNNLEVDFGEIPWQAMVLLETNRTLLCGGVITAPDVVVTSAHCIDGIEAKNVLIKGGEWKLGVDEEPGAFQIVQVKEIIKHPGYQAKTLQNDMAILKLVEKLRFAPHINAICPPAPVQREEYLYSGRTQCIVTGWGKKVLQINIPNSIMHSVDMSLVEPGQCQAQIRQNYPHLLEQYNSNSCICGQPANPIASVCKVDIGSALACTNGNGVYYMEGVYSWDSGCTGSNQIAAFYKFDTTWYESALELKVTQSQQQLYQENINGFSQVTGNSKFQQTYNQNSNAQFHQQNQESSNVNYQKIESNFQHLNPVQSFSVNGFKQVVGDHVHTGAQCPCVKGKK